jgi:hypothetical protein
MLNKVLNVWESYYNSFKYNSNNKNNVKNQQDDDYNPSNYEHQIERDDDKSSSDESTSATKFNNYILDNKNNRITDQNDDHNLLTRLSHLNYEHQIERSWNFDSIYEEDNTIDNNVENNNKQQVEKRKLLSFNIEVSKIDEYINLNFKDVMNKCAYQYAKFILKLR